MSERYRGLEAGLHVVPVVQDFINTRIICLFHVI